MGDGQAALIGSGNVDDDDIGTVIGILSFLRWSLSWSGSGVDTVMARGRMPASFIHRDSVWLAVEIDEVNGFAGFGESSGQARCGGRFADAAFGGCAGDDDGIGHGKRKTRNGKIHIYVDTRSTLARGKVIRKSPFSDAEKDFQYAIYLEQTATA